MGTSPVGFLVCKEVTSSRLRVAVARARPAHVSTGHCGQGDTATAKGGMTSMRLYSRPTRDELECVLGHERRRGVNRCVASDPRNESICLLFSLTAKDGPLPASTIPSSPYSPAPIGGQAPTKRAPRRPAPLQREAAPAPGAPN